MADFRYGVFDAQIILVTNWNFLKARHRLTESTLLTLFTQTVVKCLRDLCNCDKVILCWDTKPYHRHKLVPWQKGDRFHISAEFVADYKKKVPISDEEALTYEKQLILENRGLSQEELDQNLAAWKEEHPSQSEYDSKLAEYIQELEYENIKENTKQLIKKEFQKIGMISLSYLGWEADDLGLLCANILKNDKKPSFICSKDSDWRYLINPNVEIMRYHRSDMESYEKVRKEVSGDFGDISLYEYKAIVDSLRGSHNNYQDCRKEKQLEPKRFVEALHSGNIEVMEEYCDTDIFLPQYNSFFIEKYPDFKQVYEEVVSKLCNRNIGSIYPKEDFRLFSNSVGLNISESYYEKYCNLIDEGSYGESKPLAPKVDIDAIFNSL